MTTLKDAITRNTDAILDALQLRLGAKPRDAELEAMIDHADKVLSMAIPDPLPIATAENRAAYLTLLAAKKDALPALFRTAGSPRRALQNLIIWMESAQRLLQAQYLTLEEVNELQGEMLAMYAVYAPIESLQ